MGSAGECYRSLTRFIKGRNPFHPAFGYNGVGIKSPQNGTRSVTKPRIASKHTAAFRFAQHGHKRIPGGYFGRFIGGCIIHHNDFKWFHRLSGQSIETRRQTLLFIVSGYDYRNRYWL